jgi:hypothetical protein
MVERKPTIMNKCAGSPTYKEDNISTYQNLHLTILMKCNLRSQCRKALPAKQQHNIT